MIDHDALRALLRNAASVLPTRDRLIFSAMLRGLRPEEARERPTKKKKVHSWRKKGKRARSTTPKQGPQGDLFDGA